MSNARLALALRKWRQRQVITAPDPSEGDRTHSGKTLSVKLS